MNKNKILITGALGMLGAELTQQLAQSKAEVHLLLLDTASISVFKSKKRFILGNLASTVEYIHGDVLDVKLLRKILSQVHTVYHLAGIVSYDKKMFERMFQVNVEGTSLLVRIASEQKVSKMVYASSISAVAARQNRQSTEEDYPLGSEPSLSQYSVSKIQAERAFFTNIPGNQMTRVAANIGVIIGKSQPLNMVVAAINRHRIFPYLKTLNSYIDVSDVACGLLLLANSGVDGQRYILTSYNISNGEFTREIVKALGRRKHLVTVPSFALSFGYLLFSTFSHFIETDAWKSITVNKSYSTAKIRSLGWSPKLTLSESIHRLLST